MAQYRRNIAVGTVGERKQPMLDLDIVVRARQRHPGRRFERPSAYLVQPAHKLLEIDRGHPVFPGETPLFLH